ncbi:helix-turn-helix domain-containing protein [Streptomyces galilaeus]|uniref:helix-turn-helix domain-containing protein n=1 Tax=Streptomyces galilaeus TaxID=33899 RepID=UPI0038F7237D
METTTRLGSVGQRVAKEVARLRGRTTVRELSTRLSKLGRPILPSGITKIEQGKRRVDVDDLVALAVALEVTPTRLLMGPPPPDGGASDPAHDDVWEEGEWVSSDGTRRSPLWTIRLAPDLALEPWEAWTWALGESPLGEIWRLADEGRIEFPEDLQARFRAQNQPPPLTSYFGASEDVQSAMHRTAAAVEGALEQGLTEEQIVQVVARAASTWRRDKAVREQNQKRYHRGEKNGDNDA